MKTSFLTTVNNGFYWKSDKVKDGYRLSVHKQNFDNPQSAGGKDEIGYIHVVPLGSGYFEVLNVEVLPQFQRQGLGSKLYYKARDRIKMKGGKGIVSRASERTPEATKLWKALKGAKRKGDLWLLL